MPYRLSIHQLVIHDFLDLAEMDKAQDKIDVSHTIHHKQKYNVLLAGGLNTENIQRITQDLTPWGVDVSSGVEFNGIKDKDKIESFILSVQGVKY